MHLIRLLPRTESINAAPSVLLCAPVALPLSICRLTSVFESHPKDAIQNQASYLPHAGPSRHMDRHPCQPTAFQCVSTLGKSPFSIPRCLPDEIDCPGVFFEMPMTPHLLPAHFQLSIQSFTRSLWAQPLLKYIAFPSSSHDFATFQFKPHILIIIIPYVQLFASQRLRSCNLSKASLASKPQKDIG